MSAAQNKNTPHENHPYPVINTEFAIIIPYTPLGGCILLPMTSDNSPSKIAFWHLIYLMTLVCLGALSREEFRHMLAASDDGILLVYDEYGRSHLLMPDHL